MLIQIQIKNQNQIWKSNPNLQNQIQIKFGKKTKSKFCMDKIKNCMILLMKFGFGLKFGYHIWTKMKISLIFYSVWRLYFCYQTFFWRNICISLEKIHKYSKHFISRHFLHENIIFSSNFMPSTVITFQQHVPPPSPRLIT